MLERTEPVPISMPFWGIFALESLHAPSFRMGLSQHDFMEIFLVFSGTGTFQINRELFACKPHDVIIVPPRAEHEIIDNPAQPLWLIGICINPSIWQHESGFIQKLGYGRRNPKLELALNFRAYLRRILFEQSHPTNGHVLRITGITQQFLGELIRLSPCNDLSNTNQRTVIPSSRQRVSDYISQLSSTFYEPDSIDQVANKLQLSRRRFTALFRELTGESWAQYVTKLRLDYAQQLLKETSRTIESIAFESGYEELSGFYRAFRREVGMSPKQYRETMLIAQTKTT